MFGALQVAEGSAESGFDLHSGQLEFETLTTAIRRAQARTEPLVLAGTSFAFVHLLDAIAEGNAQTSPSLDWSLPPGSRLMETQRPQ